MFVLYFYFYSQYSSNGDVCRPFDASISTTTTTNSFQLPIVLLQSFRILLHSIPPL